MAHYRILKNNVTGFMFVVARRTIDSPGRVPIRDWVKLPCDESGYPDWSKAMYTTPYTNRTRAQVEDELLNASDSLSIHSVRQL